MGVQTLAEIRATLDAHGLRPNKALGQNFLIDQNLVRKLVASAEVGSGDIVLEVGPGTGVLTDALVESGARVVACELDRGLAGVLRERFAERITLIEGDCLASKREVAPQVISAIGGGEFKLVANLPYGCATPLMMTLLVAHRACLSMHVTIQREVGDRLAAGEGSKAYGALSVVAQTLAEVRWIATLPPSCFWPRPAVTSAMVSVVRRHPAPAVEAEGFAAFCARLFEARRKQLGATLGRDGAWPDGVEPTDRAEGLSPEKIVALWALRGRGAGGV